LRATADFGRRPADRRGTRQGLTDAIGNAKKVIDRIEFALVAHAGIDAGTVEL
jgi:hypothetical protein